MDLVDHHKKFGFFLSSSTKDFRQKSDRIFLAFIQTLIFWKHFLDGGGRLLLTKLISPPSISVTIPKGPFGTPRLYLAPCEDPKWRKFIDS